MKWILAILTISGFNFAFWLVVSFFRYVGEKLHQLATQGREASAGVMHARRRHSMVPGILFIILAAEIIVLASAMRDLTGGFQGMLSSYYIFASEEIATLVVVVGSILFSVIGYLLIRLTRRYRFLHKVLIWLMVWAIITVFLQTYFVWFFDTAVEIVGVFLISLVSLLIGARIGWALVEEEETTPSERDGARVSINDIAVLIPAHNEEGSLRETLRALKKLIDSSNIYVASDASTDTTIKIANEEEVHVVDIQPNRGKAKALVFALDHFHLCDRYKAVTLLDADIVVNENFFKEQLSHFTDPRVAAVITMAVSKWFPHRLPRWNMLFTSYRIRLWRILQYGMRYGQTWKYTNATTIVPGGASTYRTSVLKKLEIDAPGLIIEDFNMTFEIHHRRLGRVAYAMKSSYVDPEPYSLSDYVSQIKRWNLGYWQTLKRHGFWPSFFWFVMALFTLEMALFSVIVLSIPALMFAFVMNSFQPISLFTISSLGSVTLTFFDLIIGIFLVDFLMTLLVAAIEKKPILLMYWPGFILLRFIDSLMFLVTLPLAFTTKSTGIWKSPKRTAA